MIHRRPWENPDKVVDTLLRPPSGVDETPNNLLMFTIVDYIWDIFTIDKTYRIYCPTELVYKSPAL